MKLKLHLNKVNNFTSFLLDRFAKWKPDRSKLFQMAFDHIHYGNNKKLEVYLKELNGAKTSHDLLKILNGEQYDVVPKTSANEPVGGEVEADKGVS